MTMQSDIAALIDHYDCLSGYSINELTDGYEIDGYASDENHRSIKYIYSADYDAYATQISNWCDMINEL